ncbi:MAG: hypothetical protein V4719_15390 [Planctomycetota bacterium]
MVNTTSGSMNFRALILLGLASGWPAYAALAGDRPALVPLDAAVVAEDVQRAPAPTGISQLDKRTPVVDAVYHTLEKVGVVQVSDTKPAGGKLHRVGHETAPPPVEAHVQVKGTSSDKVKKTAMSELPLDKLTPKNLARVQSVLDEVGYFRRLPTTVFAADPDVYQFFIRYPDVAVSIWRVMGISEMKMWQTGPNEYEGDSGDGSTGVIDVVYRSAEENMLICEGQYQSPILKKPIKARSLVLLKTSFIKETDGSIYVTHRADMYVAFPSQTVETVAKVLSPVTGSMADRTFTEMSLFLRMMSLAMTRRPSWVDQIAGQLDGVPDVRKQQLREVTVHVHNSERKRQGLPPLISKTIGPAPAMMPDDVAKTAQPTNGANPTASTTKVITAKPVSANNVNQSGSETSEDEEDSSTEKSSSTVEKKVETSEDKAKLEPGFEYIPRRKKS